MEAILIFLLGLLIGSAITILIFQLRKKDYEKFASSLITITEEQKEKERQQLIDYLRNSFSHLSLEALSKSTEQFLQLANQTLSKQLQSGSMTLEEKKN